MKRNIDIYDTNAISYFRYLENFLGSEGITKKINKIKRTIKNEKKNPTYLNYWVVPNASFWLGIEKSREFISKGRTFTGNITQEMYRPLELSAKLQKLTDNMPDSVKNEFKNRILTSEYLTADLFEINTASHFWQNGYDINWFENKSEPNMQIPEFSATSPNFSFEVECKSKHADTGRKINRKSFYQLVDSIGTELFEEGYVGTIEIKLPDRLPSTFSWRMNCASEICKGAKSNLNNILLNDGTSISLSVYKTDKIIIPNINQNSNFHRENNPYSNVAVFMKNYKGILISALKVKVESENHDAFLRGVFEELRRANRQPTGELPSLLCCFIPEINTFEGLENDSALTAMTYAFFENHAKTYVFGVSYSSETIITSENLVITRGYPSLTYNNHKYDESFGKPPSVYSPTN